MNNAKAGLRGFLQQELGASVARIRDRKNLVANFAEGFVMETTREIGNPDLFALLQRYYLQLSGTEKVEIKKGDIFLQVMRTDKSRFTVIVHNESKIGGAAFYGGSGKRGAIVIDVHSEKSSS